MLIEILCNAIEKNDYAEVTRLIQENGALLDLNAVDPKKNLRPIDVAAQQCSKEMLMLLVSHGASLSRSQSHKDQRIENIVIQTAFGKSASRKDTYNWLLEPQQLLLLQDEGIRSEHLNAILKKEATLQDNLSLEDNDGLLPCHYSALTESSNPYFSSWLPNEMKDSFLNKSPNGFYQGATGAWWLSATPRGISILQQYFASILNTIDLYAEPINKVNRPNGKVLNQLLRYADGKEIVTSLPDEIFFNINWNTKSNNDTTAAWQLACGLSHNFARLFQLLPDRLAQIDWNASPSLEEYKGVTVALKMGELAGGQMLLRSLPSNIINSIDWSATRAHPKSNKSQSLINFVTTKISYEFVLMSGDIQEFKIGKIYVKEKEEKLFYTIITPKGELVGDISLNMNVPKPLTTQSLYPLRDCIFEIASNARHINTDWNYFLDKFTFDKLITLCMSLDSKDPAFPMIAIKAIKKLNESITDKAIENIEMEELQNLLSNFSSIFLALKATKHDFPNFQKEINGLKGKIIYRMSINEDVAKQLLAMPVPFFSIPNVVSNIDNPKNKVKVIAQKYLMCGEKDDRYHALLISQTWCKKEKDINSELKTNDNKSVSCNFLI